MSDPVRLVGKEVEHIFEAAAFHAIHFCVRAPCAGHRGKMFVLNIKDLGPETAGSPKLIFMIFPVVAFGTFVFAIFHFV